MRPLFFIWRPVFCSYTDLGMICIEPSHRQRAFNSAAVADIVNTQKTEIIFVAELGVFGSTQAASALLKFPNNPTNKI